MNTEVWHADNYIFWYIAKNPFDATWLSTIRTGTPPSHGWFCIEAAAQ